MRERSLNGPATLSEWISIIHLAIPPLPPLSPGAGEGEGEGAKAGRIHPANRSIKTRLAVP